MAYLLRFAATNTVTIPEFTVPASTAFTLRGKFTFYLPAINTKFANSTTNLSQITCRPDGKVFVNINANGFISNRVFADGEIVEFEIIRQASGRVDIYFDGSATSDAGRNGATAEFSITSFSDGNYVGDLYYFECEYTPDNRYYNPSSSNGTGNLLIDDIGGDNGTLTNFPGDDSQWVFYAAGPTAYTLTADAVSDSHTAQDVTLSYSPGSTAYSITCEPVSDSHLAGLVNFYRGYQFTADLIIDAHTAQAVTLIYSAGATNYTITCETVTDSHSAGSVAFNRGYTLACDTSTDTHAAGDVTLTYTGATGTQYILTCDTVTDSHSVGDIVFNRGYVLQVSTVTDSHTVLPVILRYSGEEIALIGSYGVNYKQSDVGISYKQNLIGVTYGNG